MFLPREMFGDLFRELNRMQEFGRLINRNGFPAGGVLPAINVWEDENTVFAEIDLPGVDSEKLDVSVTEGNQLTIEAERPILEAENSVWVRQERAAGTFSRTLTLPTLVDANSVSATYEDGVLKLTLPKADAAKPRKIAVKSV